MIKSATRSKTKKNSSSALRSRPSKKVSGHIVVDLEQEQLECLRSTALSCFPKASECVILIYSDQGAFASLYKGIFERTCYVTWTHLLSFDTQLDFN